MNVIKLIIGTFTSLALGMVGFASQAMADITVVSWGGAYTMSQQKAYSDTFSDSPLVGGKVNWVNYNGGLG